MSALGWTVQAAYFTALGLLALFGLHRLSLVALYVRGRARIRRGAAAGGDGAAAVPFLPTVTVQLPIRNERYVVGRLIDAACALDHPADRLEIQVLDDSDDDTTRIAAERVASYRAAGIDIHHIRREEREGFKAGALAHGLARARGEFIAVFDADFVPRPDFLKRSLPVFHEGPGAERLGMVQARWGHINRDHSLLTRAQALMLDGHFVVEHGARQAAGRFLNFNGTAGIFRRRCIEEAGGWQADTLTEDLDLSYRAQVAGWRFEHLPDVVVPAELPVEMASLRSQQSRWARGSIQTARKLLGRILRAELPLGVRLEAAAHLTNNAAYPLLASLAILIVPALAARAGSPSTYLWIDLPLLVAGTGSLALFVAVAQREVRPDWGRALLVLPGMMALGIGLSLNNALAVLSALRRGSVPFERTPKYDIAPAGPDGSWTRLSYRGIPSRIVWLEGLFALYFAAATIAAAADGWWPAVPFLALFGSGFLWVSLLTLQQARARR